MMSNAERILRELDQHLDHEVTLVLYGRAALALGFPNPPEAVEHSLDVDAIIPMTATDVFRADGKFWDAQDATNRALEKEGLYITHLFEAKDIFLRADWERHLVPIASLPLRWLRLLRPATEDLILTKMMRGDDAQDLQDVAFLIEQARLTVTQLEIVLSDVVIPDLVEYRDAFRLAKPRVLELARRLNL